MLTPDGEFIRDRPRWALPLVRGPRYLGAYGGRGSGKSHEYAEMAVERLVVDPDCRYVGIREYQKSTRFSSKSLIERKIKELGVSHMFEVLKTEIRRIGGDGVMIFEGMQAHNADSIKSLDGFDIADIEEAQSISARSLDLLRPTILRKPGAQIWARWNPDQPEDAIEQLLRGDNVPPDAVVVSVNYDQNPYPLGGLVEEISRDRADPEGFEHTWLGGYNVKSDAIVFSRRWREEEFEPQPEWDGPYYGVDWGFAMDPTVLVELYIHGDVIYWHRESGGHGMDASDAVRLWDKEIPEARNHTIRADRGRGETVKAVKKLGYAQMVEVDKWPGSVEDGVTWMRGKTHVVHPGCEGVKREMRRYRYKQNKAGDVLPDIEDKENHRIDAGRYAVQPLIRELQERHFW